VSARPLLLVPFVLTLGCVSGAIAGALREWLSSPKSTCETYCALDSDSSCGGRSDDAARCIERCDRPPPLVPCLDEAKAMRECTSRLTCDEFRERERERGPCGAEVEAEKSCRRAVEGPN